MFDIGVNYYLEINCIKLEVILVNKKLYFVALTQIISML